MVTRVFAESRFHWVARRHPLQWVADAWNRFQEWAGRLSDAHPGIANLLLFAASIVLVALLVHIGYTLLKVYGGTARPKDLPPRTVTGFALLDARTHRARAEVLARQGQYAEALAHRFAALICDLDDAKAVSIHASKTPAEYAREARVDALGKETLVGLVARLYGALFGAQPVDETGYRDFAASSDLVLSHVGSR